METVRVPLDLLVPDPNNAREHPERNVEAVRASLERFGQVEPLVVQESTSIVIGGNARLEAMRALGWTEADCVLVNMDDAQAKALGLALNRTAEMAEWNYEQLANTVKELQALSVPILGWDVNELEPLLSATWKAPEPMDLEQFNAVPTPKQVSFVAGGKTSVDFTPEQWATVCKAVAKYADAACTDTAAVLVSLCEAALD